MHLFTKGRSPSSRPSRLRSRLHLEQLETRLVPYSVSGGVWPHPNLVTLSFVPDGTYLTNDNNGPVYSNLFATLNKVALTATWQGFGKYYSEVANIGNRWGLEK